MPASSTVLIVDDYPDALDVWALYLRAEGFRVLTATDGAHALAQVHTHRPDVVVLDLELPDVSGCDVARQLRAAPETRHIPLIAATGCSHGMQLERAREAGFDRVMVKPCDPDVLVEEIRRLASPAARPHVPESEQAPGRLMGMNWQRRAHSE